MRVKHKLILSLVISIVMLMCSYWVTNLHVPISGEKTVISWYEAIKGIFGKPDYNVENNDVLLIDVDYDKELITKTNEFGRPLGDAYPVTDRRKLLTLLDTLKKRDDYEYVMLDVAFEQGEETDADSALFAVISSMNRIVIPCDSLNALPHEMLQEKAGLAEYYITPVETDFVKYPYLKSDTTLKSMPFVMFEDVFKSKIRKHWLFYTDDSGRLARRTIVLNLDYLPKPSAWRKIGTDILYADRIKSLITKDKVVVIGSAKADLHATYRDRVSGAIINLNAYQALKDGHHIVSPPVILLLAISFFVFSYLILSQRTLSDSLSVKNFHKNKWVRLLQLALNSLCSWLGFSLFLTALCVITYSVLHEVYDIFVTSTLFYIIKKIVKFVNYMRYEK